MPVKVKYKEVYEKSKGPEPFIPDVELQHSKSIRAFISEHSSYSPLFAEQQRTTSTHIHFFALQFKYKVQREREEKYLPSGLADTMDTQSVRNVSELQSQVKRAADEVQEGSEEEGKVSLLCDMKDSGDPTCQAVSQLQSQAKYKEAGKQQFSTPLYSKLPETLETQHAKDASQLQSVPLPRARLPQLRCHQPVLSIPPYPARQRGFSH
ncbi:uncharacterized protein [Oncorhynchus clarkii lewisi]|uniref:uncharacterized protein n=1 Tax=Oncorhynchus clarkii lewisi TaxID=490388 RepID=UPI0039B9C6A2